jgi:hypothetical protein
LISKLNNMKKIISLAVILVGLSTATAFAQTPTPSVVVGSFEHKFTNAEKPTWTVVKDLYRVDFSLQNQSLTAFFNADGELVASSRNITPMQLPISLNSSLEKHFGKYIVSSLFEVDGRDGVYYYAKVSNQKSDILLKSTSFGDWVAE